VMDYAKPTTLPDGSVGLANPETNVPRLSYGPNGNQSRFTSKWVEDGSFLRVKNISLAYNLPSTLLSRQKVVNNIKLMVSAQNIATITGYKGYDPEVGADPGGLNNNMYGVDRGTYPQARTYIFGLNVTF